MKIDWSKALENVAAMPEVKRMIAGARDKGLAEQLVKYGLAAARPSMVMPAIGFFAAGAACGALAALMLAPRTGEAMRKDVAELVRGLGEKVSARATEMKESRAAKVSANGHGAATA